MKIFYVDSDGNKRLQECNLLERKGSCMEDDGAKSDSYTIINAVRDYKNETLSSHFTNLADIFRENGWRGDALRYYDKRVIGDMLDEDTDDSQSVHFGGSCGLGSDGREAFWDAVGGAVIRGDRLFDVEKWYSAFKKAKQTL